MKTDTLRFLSLLFLTLALTSIPSHASDPVGIYAIVEKVVFEPNESAPQSVQIWGAFAFSDGNSGDGYLKAQRGYLYYSLNPGKEDVCRREWNDLKAMAGTGQGIGFGGRYLPKGRVRKPGEKADAPDAYPIMMGVVRMGSQHDQLNVFAGLKRALNTH